MAKLITIANITVPAAGTAVPLSANELIVPSAIITALASNTDDVVIAESGQADAGNDVGTVIAPGKSFAINPAGIWGKEEEIDLSQIEVDANVNDEGVSISYLRK